MERFSYDPHKAPLADCLDSLDFMLMERVKSEHGMFTQALPAAPEWCDYRDDSEAYAEAQKEYRNSLCTVPTLRTRDEYIRHLCDVGG